MWDPGETQQAGAGILTQVREYPNLLLENAGAPDLKQETVPRSAYTSSQDSPLNDPRSIYGQYNTPNKGWIFMQVEAEITINGAKLSDTESMTVRVAIDTLANVLVEGLGLENDGIALTDRYMASLSRIQTLLESRETRKQ
jgi:hypothetical protein